MIKELVKLLWELSDLQDEIDNNLQGISGPRLRKHFLIGKKTMLISIKGKLGGILDEAEQKHWENHMESFRRTSPYIPQPRKSCR